MAFLLFDNQRTLVFVDENIRTLAFVAMVFLLMDNYYRTLAFAVEVMVVAILIISYHDNKRSKYDYYCLMIYLLIYYYYNNCILILSTSLGIYTYIITRIFI